MVPHVEYWDMEGMAGDKMRTHSAFTFELDNTPNHTDLSNNGVYQYNSTQVVDSKLNHSKELHTEYKPVWDGLQSKAHCTVLLLSVRRLPLRSRFGSFVMLLRVLLRPTRTFVG